jgi:hypothetical protein
MALNNLTVMMFVVNRAMKLILARTLHTISEPAYTHPATVTGSITN